jgi:hypothetical protein
MGPSASFISTPTESVDNEESLENIVLQLQFQGLTVKDMILEVIMETQLEAPLLNANTT